VAASEEQDMSRTRRKHDPAFKAKAALSSFEPVMRPAEIQARVLYRDNLILIIDKPAGLPVHGGPGGEASLEDYLGALKFGLPEAPALAHRLDRDTSGCLLLARRRKALGRLGRLFESRAVEKTYWAIVAGAPPEAGGRIEIALRKENKRSGWRMVADPGGQRAVTDYRLLASAKGVSLLELKPLTGRTHQVRVHCATLGCPVIGDPVYGQAAPGSAMQLHARALALPLREGKPPVAATAPPPPHMKELMGTCGFNLG
jgi:tRNA pseudouridine32 synthase/23S rRNA pseudouridine746 synthase/23S rRNA pseudouridine1911/1915/1917 synthase